MLDLIQEVEEIRIHSHEKNPFLVLWRMLSGELGDLYFEKEAKHISIN